MYKIPTNKRGIGIIQNRDVRNIKGKAKRKGKKRGRLNRPFFMCCDRFHENFLNFLSFAAAVPIHFLLVLKESLLLPS